MLSEKKNLVKIAEPNNKAPRQCWTAVKSLLNDTMRNRPNLVHSNSWKPYFQKLLNVQRRSDNCSNLIEKLTDFENQMAGKQGPLDFDISEIISVIKSLKLNKANS